MKQLIAYAVMALLASPAMAMSAPVSCVVDGCSGELCRASDAEQIMSTCEYHESFSCYKDYGVCEVHSDGKCGWTESDALKACLKRLDKEAAR